MWAMDGNMHGYQCVVKNSFLHFEQPGDRGGDLRRSQSWCVSSSESESLTAGSLSGSVPAETRQPRQGAKPLHQIYDTSSSNGSDVGEPQRPRVQGDVGELQCPPVQQAANDASSAGTSLHDSGTCHPCRFLQSASGCMNATACQFCHHKDHVLDEKCQRPSKGVRNGYKKNIKNLAESDMTDAEKREAYIALANKGFYMRLLLKDVIPDVDEIYECNASELVSAPIQTPGLVSSGHGSTRLSSAVPGEKNFKAIRKGNGWATLILLEGPGGPSGYNKAHEPYKALMGLIRAL